MAIELVDTPAPLASDRDRPPQTMEIGGGTGSGLWPAVLGGAAAALGGMALWAHRHAQRAEEENPPIGRFVDADGVRLHYLERGAGVPVVLLHGAGMMLQDWTTSIMDRLARSYRVVAFDRPGYGYSERPKDRTWTPLRQAMLVRKALHRLGVERPVIVGHSFSALVATAYALSYPDEVRGVVLESGYCFPTPRLDFPGYAVPSLPVIGPVWRNTVSPVTGKVLQAPMLAQMFAPNPVTPEFWDGFPRDLALRPLQLRAAAEDFAVLRASAAHMMKRYAALEVPSHIVTGGADMIVDPDAHSGRLHQMLPQAGFTLVPGVGHMLHHIAPEPVVAAVDGLARGASGRDIEMPRGRSHD